MKEGTKTIKLSTWKSKSTSECGKLVVAAYSCTRIKTATSLQNPARIPTALKEETQNTSAFILNRNRFDWSFIQLRKKGEKGGEGGNVSMCW